MLNMISNKDFQDMGMHQENSEFLLPRIFSLIL